MYRGHGLRVFPACSLSTSSVRWPNLSSALTACCSGLVQRSSVALIRSVVHHSSPPRSRSCVTGKEDGEFFHLSSSIIIITGTQHDSVDGNSLQTPVARLEYLHRSHFRTHLKTAPFIQRHPRQQARTVSHTLRFSDLSFLSLVHLLQRLRHKRGKNSLIQAHRPDLAGAHLGSPGTGPFLSNHSSFDVGLQLLGILNRPSIQGSAPTCAYPSRRGTRY